MLLGKAEVAVIGPGELLLVVVVVAAVAVGLLVGLVGSGLR